MSQAHVADPANYLRIELDVGWIVYSRQNHALGEHSIMRGRDDSSGSRRCSLLVVNR